MSDDINPTDKKYRFELVVKNYRQSLSIAFADNKETLNRLIMQNLQRVNGLHATWYQIYEHIQFNKRIKNMSDNVSPTDKRCRECGEYQAWCECHEYDNDEEE